MNDDDYLDELNELEELEALIESEDYYGYETENKEKKTDKNKNMELGICCGNKMIINDNDLICNICGNITPYINDIFVEPHSQQTTYDNSGNMIHGHNSKKNNQEKISDLVKECNNYILETSSYELNSALLRDVCKIAVKIFDETIYKKENRRCTFAAILHVVSMNKGFIYDTKELVKMFGLNKCGISQGLTILYTYQAIFKDLNIKLDLDIYHHIINKFLNSLIYDVKNKGKLSLASSTSNLEFCIQIVEFMLNNNIAYNTTIKTKCAGSVFYFIQVLRLKSKNKKTITEKLGVSQNTIIKTFNIISLPEVQNMLPLYLKIDTYK